MSNEATGGWLGTVIVFAAVFEPPSWSSDLQPDGVVARRGERLSARSARSRR